MGEKPPDSVTGGGGVGEDERDVDGGGFTGVPVHGFLGEPQGEPLVSHQTREHVPRPPLLARHPQGAVGDVSAARSAPIGQDGREGDVVGRIHRLPVAQPANQHVRGVEIRHQTGDGDAFAQRNLLGRRGEDVERGRPGVVRWGEMSNIQSNRPKNREIAAGFSDFTKIPIGI